MKSWMAGVVTTLVVAAIAAAIILTSGIIDVAADSPHWKGIYKTLEYARQRAVDQQVQGMAVPDLSNSQSIRKGAGEYAEMCMQCHLAPGMQESNIRLGLNPQPPNLFLHRTDPASAFWIVKHGIKMTGMPAWGMSHDDETIWNIVAFLQKMPEMNAAQYNEMVGEAPAHGSEAKQESPHGEITVPKQSGHTHARPH